MQKVCRIKERQGFSFSRYWEQLVWMDPTNYAGVKSKSPEDSNGSNNDAEEDEEDGDKENEDTVLKLEQLKYKTTSFI